MSSLQQFTIKNYMFICNCVHMTEAVAYIGYIALGQSQMEYSYERWYSNIVQYLRHGKAAMFFQSNVVADKYKYTHRL